MPRSASHDALLQAIACCVRVPSPRPPRVRFSAATSIVYHLTQVESAPHDLDSQQNDCSNSKDLNYTLKRLVRGLASPTPLVLDLLNVKLVPHARQAPWLSESVGSVLVSDITTKFWNTGTPWVGPFSVWRLGSNYCNATHECRDIDVGTVIVGHITSAAFYQTQLGIDIVEDFYILISASQSTSNFNLSKFYNHIFERYYFATKSSPSHRLLPKNAKQSAPQSVASNLISQVDPKNAKQSALAKGNFPIAPAADGWISNTS
ncbi:uncharacterized protein PGTG_22722 [Puccinia graminis f. sp. tritici CRL 75-36-700-3]|uniref:Uncharacterized protein n=1 Tax=Puccinia graminis f. sp. tritici (strain CRL 75-36-700-3 / race SCCL) TaxID=418459 RepID=H6QVE7_PUCGT|nr:uncharacterized protein PGTG_22722 [Puccinia graminis f. sp. tritici CRL 75-36-700-3]EHS62901.1 hypothetical protein PGTG_22722 [Puccinia graminis f. sp. tritici CRL 75-36-700-3]